MFPSSYLCHRSKIVIFIFIVSVCLVVNSNYVSSLLSWVQDSSGEHQQTLRNSKIDNTPDWERKVLPGWHNNCMSGEDPGAKSVIKHQWWRGDRSQSSHANTVFCVQTPSISWELTPLISEISGNVSFISNSSPHTLSLLSIICFYWCPYCDNIVMLFTRIMGGGLR